MDESGKLNRGCNKHHRSPTARFHFLFLLFPMFPLLTTATYILSPELLSRYRVSTACKRDPPLYLSPFWSITDLDPFPQANRNSFRERMLSFFFFFLIYLSFPSRIRPLFPIPLNHDWNASNRARRKLGCGDDSSRIGQFRGKSDSTIQNGIILIDNLRLFLFSIHIGKSLKSFL